MCRTQKSTLGQIGHLVGSRTNERSPGIPSGKPANDGQSLLLLLTPINAIFPKNSLSGEVLGLALRLSVFGAGLHPDGHGCPETPLNVHYSHPEQS